MLKRTLRVALILAITACASAGTPVAEAVPDYGTPTRIVTQAELRQPGMYVVGGAIEEAFKVELSTSNVRVTFNNRDIPVRVEDLRGQPIDQLVAVEYYAASQTRPGRPRLVVRTRK
jgi:hypothetical protein